jgi:predicted transcriptional regulator
MTNPRRSKHGRERLAVWLRRRELSQTAAARLLGTSPPNVSRWLSGRQTPRLEHLLSIERLTGIPASSWARTDASASEAA